MEVRWHKLPAADSAGRSGTRVYVSRSNVLYWFQEFHPDGSWSGLGFVQDKHAEDHPHNQDDGAGIDHRGARRFGHAEDRDIGLAALAFLIAGLKHFKFVVDEGMVH